MMAESVQEKLESRMLSQRITFSSSSDQQKGLKLKRTVLDTWSTREKLSLASLVLRSGDQNWSCVSRNIRIFAEPNRPPDWFSPKNCAQQYASLLENVETPKRKKRVAGSNERSEVETPGESIVRKLKADRIEELKKKMEEIRGKYLKVKEASNSIISREADDKIPLMLQEIEEYLTKPAFELNFEYDLQCVKFMKTLGKEFANDKGHFPLNKKNEIKKKELEKEAHIKWLKEREERKIELERAWKPGSRLMTIRRASSMSEPSSEADSPLSEPLNVDVPEETTLNKPTPTSPLLTSLLKSPSTVSQPSSQTTSSILHSAITSPHRGSSPTIASLLSSSPGLPGNFVMPPSSVSSNLKNLVSNAIASSLSEEHKTLPTSPSQGAPTLSMLLELPPSLPGKPLPMLKPQPSASPPPYSEHLGPPPPYSQATEYLQKQRAEELAAQNQAKAKVKEEENKIGVLTPAEPPSLPTTPPSFAQNQPLATRRGSLKIRQLDLQNENEMEEEPQTQQPTPKPSPTKEKESKRILHNTSDHDYVETPSMKEKDGAKQELNTPKKAETDVFEFDELKEGYDKIDLMMKDSKMSYLKSSAQRLALKKETEATGQRKIESLPSSSPVKSGQAKAGSPDKEIDAGEEESKTVVDEDPSEVETKEAETKSPAKEEAKGSARHSTEGQKEEPTRRKSSLEEEKPTKKEEEVDQTCEGDAGEQNSESASSDQEENNKNRRKSEDLGEQSEEEKAEAEDADAAKEEDVGSSLLDMAKSDKADLSTTEDEKSNDATPKVYSRRRGGPSFSDSVPNSPAPITEEEKEYKAWKKAVMLVYTRIAGHKYASLFLKPINDDQAPEYSFIVKRPMDLSTVKRNIELGNIRTTAEFQRDVMLMFLNALMYNERDHDVYKMAKEMQADSLEHFQMLLRVADENTPFRRETRTQQNADVKLRTGEKPSGKLARGNAEAEKPFAGSPEVKQRGRMRNSPRPGQRTFWTSEKVNRKRNFSGVGDSSKKRLKVDE